VKELTGEIRIRTLKKFLTIYGIARDRNRSLTVQEIAETIHCCKGHAYNYQRALDKLLSTMLGISQSSGGRNHA
jgi:hypothetical protein